MEEICNQYNGSGSGLIIRSASLSRHMSYRTVELTRKRRGGMMGERLVYTSFTAPAKITTHPTTRSAMVDADDPRYKSKIQSAQSSDPSYSQLVSLWLKPTSTSTTPETNKNNPTKSNSLRCSLKVLPWCGLRLRKKNRRAAAKPPVGLPQSVKR